MPYAVAAAAAVVGAGVSYAAAEKAGDDQYAATQEAIAAQARSEARARGDYAPFRDASLSSLNELMRLLGLPQPGRTEELKGTPVYQSMGRGGQQLLHYKYPDGTTGRTATKTIRVGDAPGSTTGIGGFYTMADLQNDPILRAALESGSKAGQERILNVAAARGETDHGNTLRAIVDYSHDLTNRLGGESYARKLGLTQILAALSGAGGTGSLQLGQLGQLGAANTGSLLTQGGNASAASTVGGANAVNNALTQISNAYQTQALLDRFLGKNTTPNANVGTYGTSGGFGTTPQPATQPDTSQFAYQPSSAAVA